MAINMYFSIISQGEAPGNRLVPGGGLAIMESYSQWKQTPRKRQEAKHTPALGKKLALITELFCPYMEPLWRMARGKISEDATWKRDYRYRFRLH